jgi:hypothetical protein
VRDKIKVGVVYETCSGSLIKVTKIDGSFTLSNLFRTVTYSEGEWDVCTHPPSRNCFKALSIKQKAKING